MLSFLNKLKTAINEFEQASEALVCAAKSAYESKLITLSLQESRDMRDKILVAEVLGARAERTVLEIPIKN